VFKVDHPKADMVSALVRATPTRRTPRPPREPRKKPEGLNDLQKARERFRDDGITNKPLGPPEPPAKAAVAVKQGDVDVLKKQLSLDLTEAQRNDLLSLAARHAQVDCMGVLLEAGADPKGTDRLGRTPLMAAVQSRDVAAIQYLLERGADVNARDKLEGTALLRAAGLQGNVESVQVLLAAGADVNVKDKSGMTPLMWAARWGDAGRVTVLLKAGADVNARDVRGKTALDWARSQGEKAQERISILEPVTEGEAESSQPAAP
jgi:ankyrin repeat protein